MSWNLRVVPLGVRDGQRRSSVDAARGRQIHERAVIRHVVLRRGGQHRDILDQPHRLGQQAAAREVDARGHQRAVTDEHQQIGSDEPRRQAFGDRGILTAVEGVHRDGRIVLRRSPAIEQAAAGGQRIERSQPSAGRDRLRQCRRPLGSPGCRWRSVKKIRSSSLQVAASAPRFAVSVICAIRTVALLLTGTFQIAAPRHESNPPIVG